MTLILKAETAIPWKLDDLVGVVGQFVFIGPNPDGLGGFEVAVAESKAPLNRETLKQLLLRRRDKRTTDVVVAVVVGKNVQLVGPNEERQPLLLPLAAAERHLQAALSESDSLDALRRFTAIAEAHSSSEMPGVRNLGLFASYHLRENVPKRQDWAAHARRSKELAKLRHRELIEGLGYRVISNVGQGLLLGGDVSPTALALLLEESEGFESKSNRFQTTPVDWALSAAATQNVMWVIVLRKEQIRLYAAKDGVGVGTRGQSETYLELDLAAIDEGHIGLLTMLFSCESLASEGLTPEILAESTRFASGLSQRLRDRVYDGVMPAISEEIARQLRFLGYELDNKNLTLAYSLALRVLFRLLFQAYAEDRGLLPSGRNERYDANSLSTIAQREINTPPENFGSAASIWFDMIQVWDAIDEGNDLWQVPAYNGGLFGSDEVHNAEGALLKKIRLPDSVLGPALQALLIDENTEDGVRGAVDFRALSVREFGTIYEGLLESSLSLADTPLTLKDGAWLPSGKGDVVHVHSAEPYFHSASGDRKATGSYFTPGFAVDHLVSEAIGPSLEKHLARIKNLLDSGDEARASREFFDYRVADLAMGSGHFLVAAVDAIETKMREFLSTSSASLVGVNSELQRLYDSATEALGSDEFAKGSIEPGSLLRRQIAKRCVYGIDINPLAVELSRLALWIHTFVPGLPMSSLDHALVCANSLTGIGTISEAVDALQPGVQKGHATFFDGMIESSLTKAKDLLLDAANASEANKAEIADSRDLAERARLAAESTKQIFNVALAARSGIPGAHETYTEADLLAFAKRPEVVELVSQTIPAHMPYLFPEVFMRENPGFDALLGNPPWEKLYLDEQRWWGLHLPGLRVLNPEDKKKRIEDYRQQRPDLNQLFEEALRVAHVQNDAISKGPYPGIGAAHIDLVSAFAWRNWQLLRHGGRFAVVFPRGSLGGSALTLWRNEIMDQGEFKSITFLTNTKTWVFKDVHAQYTVALTVVNKERGSNVTFSGPFYSLEEWHANEGNNSVVPIEEFKSWSETAVFPQVPDASATGIYRQMMKSPRISEARNDWDYQPMQGDMNSSTDKHLLSFDGPSAENNLEVWGGSSYNIWQIDGGPFAYANSENIRGHLFDKYQRSRGGKKSAYSGMDFSPEKSPIDRARVSFRLISNSTNRRTIVTALVPPGTPLVHSAPVLIRRKGSEKSEAFLLGAMSSIPFDWAARRWVELNVTFELFNNFPIPKYDENSLRCARVVQLAGSIAAVDDRYSSWAESVGVPVGSVTDQAHKNECIYEIDALICLLYGLNAEQSRHLFETFHRGWDYQERLECVMRYFKEWEQK